MPRGEHISLPPSCGHHQDGGEWVMPDSQPIISPDFLSAVRYAISEGVGSLPCVLPDYRLNIREVPKRTPLCWKNSPPDDDYGRHYVIDDTVFIDGIFQALYSGSPTFRAMLIQAPSITKTPASLDEPKGFLAEYHFGRREVEINYDLKYDSKLIATPFAVIAHEYRHRFQEEIKAAFSLDTPIALTHFFPLMLAAEADAMCFGLICCYETLLHQAYSPQVIEDILRREADYLGHEIVIPFIQETQATSLLSGDFSRAIVRGFLSTDDGLARNYIRNYTEFFREQTGNPLRFALAPPALGTAPQDIKIIYTDATGQLALDIAPANSINSDKILRIYFERLARMAYMTQGNTVAERPNYMKTVSADDFLHVLYAPR